MTRPRLLFGLVFGVLAYGLGTTDSGVVALAIPLVVYLGVSFLRQPGNPRLTVERTLTSSQLAHDTPTSVTLRLTNRGGAIDSILVNDGADNGLRVVDGDVAVFASLESGESVELRYDAIAPRGEFAFGPTTITVADMFNVATRRIEVTAPSSLSMEPERAPVRPSGLRPARTRGFNGPIPGRTGGSGTDFFNLREYEAGDRLRWINWRVTQRMSTRLDGSGPAATGSQENAEVLGGARAGDPTGGLYSNVYEQQRIADVGLIVDARSSVDFSVGGVSYFERSIAAATSLADSFIGSGHRVGLLVFGAGLDSVFPGYGNVQRQRIIHALGKAKTGDHYIFSNLSNLPTRFFRPGSQVVFVGPCGDDDVAMLTRLRSMGHAVLAVSADPVGFQLQVEARTTGRESSREFGRDADADPDTTPAVRLARLERDLTLQRLRRVGVQVVDWDPRRPLDTAMHEALRSARIPPVVRIP